MSSETIKAFFKGTFSEVMITSPRSFEYRVTDKKEVEAYQKLRSQLAGEALKLFDEFVNLSGECQTMGVENEPTASVFALQWSAWIYPT